MQQILPELNSLGAELVAISPELPDNTLAMEEKNAITFEILSDQGNVYAKQCGLVFTLAEELRPIYKNWGINLSDNNGDSTFELPLPATYVVDKNYRIISSFIDTDYTKRHEPMDILNILRDI